MGILELITMMLLVPVTTSALCLRRTALRSRLSATTVHAMSASPDDLPSGDTQVKRRRKKNKYGQFSKADQLDIDPFEAMIAEAVKENEHLEEELSKTNPRHQHQAPDVPIILDTPAMSFPDTRAIDPYDPTTFGYLEIASIGGAHGVHGLIKVRCLTDFASERLCTAGIRHIKMPNKRAPRPITLLEGRHRHADEYLIRLDGFPDRESAMKLRGSILYAREDDLVEKDSEEYIVSDLIGLDVFLYEDKEIGDRNFVGKVNGIVFASDVSDIPGMHDFLELVLPRGQGGTASIYDELVLIPFVPQLVPVVDIKDGSIYVDPPEGLLDLSYSRHEKVRIKAFLPAPKATTTVEKLN